MFSKYVAEWSFKDGQLKFYDTSDLLRSMSQVGLKKPVYTLTAAGWLNHNGEVINFADPFEIEQFRDDLERYFVLKHNGTFFQNSLIDETVSKKLDFAGTLAFAFMQNELILDDRHTNALNEIFPNFNETWMSLVEKIKYDNNKIVNLLSFTIMSAEVN